MYILENAEILADITIYIHIVHVAYVKHCPKYTAQKLFVIFFIFVKLIA